MQCPIPVKSKYYLTSWPPGSLGRWAVRVREPRSASWSDRGTGVDPTSNPNPKPYPDPDANPDPKTGEKCGCADFGKFIYYSDLRTTTQPLGQ